MKKVSWLGLAVALATAGCQATRSVDSDELAMGETLPEGTSLEAMFESAAHEFAVPTVLLKSIAWTETRWQMISGEDELGQDAAYGLLALRGARLAHGADLAGVSEEEARFQPLANLRAGAALLDEAADALAIDRANLADWAEVVAEASGIEEFDGQQAYVLGEVYRALQLGVATEVMNLPALDVVANFPAADGTPGPGLDYGGSLWRPSPNYGARPAGTTGKPTMVIIHSCEGSYSGCWGWLKSSKSKVSAHYVVSPNGGEITQLVREKSKAWHIAADYQCSLNSKTDCGLSGVSSNNFTIGIEHAGYASQSSWDDGLLENSAKLVCDITKAWGIPRDKFHVVGHGQLQPYNRVDPGKAWPWGKYLGLIDAACGANPSPQDPPSQDPAPPPPQDPPPSDPQDPSEPPVEPPAALIDLIVDTNNSFNTKDALCVIPASWTPSNNVSGFFNTGYAWRSVGQTTDLVEFRVKLDKPRKLKVQAWWPAASDRSSQTPFLVFDANKNQLDAVYVDQRKNGGQWSELGTYTFPAGWNVVAVSRWTSGSGVVVADAVRFTEVK